MMSIRVIRQCAHHAAEVEGTLAVIIASASGGRGRVRTAGVTASGTAVTTAVGVWGWRRWRWVFTIETSEKVKDSRGERWWWGVSTVGMRRAVGTVWWATRAAEHAERVKGEEWRRAAVFAATTAVASVRARSSVGASAAEGPTAVSTMSSAASLAAILVSLGNLLGRVRRVVMHHGIGAIFLLLFLATGSILLLLAIKLGGRSSIGSLVIANVLGEVFFTLRVGAGAGFRALVGGAVLTAPVTVSTMSAPTTGVVMSMRAVSPGALTWGTRSPAIPEVWVHEGRQPGRRRGGRCVVDASTARWVVVFGAVHGVPEGIEIVWPGHVVVGGGGVIVVGNVCVRRWKESCLMRRWTANNVTNQTEGQREVKYIEKRSSGGEPLRSV